MAGGKGSGRRKTPTALRRDGVPNPHEPDPDKLEEVPPPPDHLTGRARDFWNSAASELVALGVLTSLDLPLLACWAELAKRHVLAVTAMNALEVQDPSTHGTIIRSSSGAAYQNPLLGVISSTAREMRRLGQELGLSPSGRAGLVVSRAPERETIARKFDL
jgi:P27 family predicted phage terminase small subunit